MQKQRKFSLFFVLAVLLIVVAGVYSTTLNPFYFETGFETGDLSEVNTEITDPATITVVSSKSYSGTYSAKIYTWTYRPGADPEWHGGYGRGRICKPISLYKVYIRAFFYVDYWDGKIQCIRTSGHTPSGGYVYIARVVIAENYVELQLGHYKQDQPDRNWHPIQESGPVVIREYTSIETDRWHKIQMGFGKQPGFAKIWLNDGQSPIISYQGDFSTMTCPNVDKAIVGVCLYQKGVDPAVLYVDDFAVSDAFIGTEPPPNGNGNGNGENGNGTNGNVTPPEPPPDKGNLIIETYENATPISVDVQVEHPNGAVETVTTDPTGRYVMYGVEPGSYTASSVYADETLVYGATVEVGQNTYLQFSWGSIPPPPPSTQPEEEEPEEAPVIPNEVLLLVGILAVGAIVLIGRHLRRQRKR